MKPDFDPTIRMIPIDQITVLNPRKRGPKKFNSIVANIGKLGLKKPVTVYHAGGADGDARYQLVCGQGRLEAYIALGQTEIPAILVNADKEHLLVMSLVENIARRRHTTLELVQHIAALKKRGYKPTEIARKTDLVPEYVRAIIQLLEKGEERLLEAVERGQLPVNIAVTIATADDKDVQRALQEAYERNDLRGKALIRARRLIETRRAKGKTWRGGQRTASDSGVSSNELLRTFQQETLKQKMAVQKAKVCETRLLFAVSALRQLFQSEHFQSLLRAEKLDVLPAYLAEQIESERSSP